MGEVCSLPGGGRSNRYVDELLSHLASFVNTKELSAAPAFYESLCHRVDRKYVYARLALALDEYNPLKAESRTRPIPDCCHQYTGPDWEKAKKLGAELEEVNSLIASTRKKAMHHISDALGEAPAPLKKGVRRRSG